MVEWNVDVGKTSAETKKDSALFSDKDIKAMIDEGKNIDLRPVMNTLVIGADGSSKTGIVLDYCSKLDKPTIILDLDNGVLPLIGAYYKDSKKFILPRILETTVKDNDVDIDYIKTMARIKVLIKYAIEHQNEFGAIVLDGMSTLLKYSEYQSRMERNIAPDGGMQMRYWMIRNKLFLEIVEIMKSANNLDKFYIAHEDLIASEEGAAVKRSLNAMVHQRIICSRTDNLGKVTFTAKIDKSKYNLGLEGKVFTIATAENGKTSWKVNVFDELIGKTTDKK